MAKTDVAKKEAEKLPANYMDEKGSFGSEHVSSQDIALPFLRILQSGSPEKKKANAKYIEGADEGMILDTVNKSVLDGDKGITVIKAQFMSNYVEWIPRDQTGGGGGFVANHSREEGDALLAKHGLVGMIKPMLPNGNLLTLTYMFFVIVIDEKDGSFYPAIIPMSSTNLKAGRNWNSAFTTQRAKHQLKSDAGLVSKLRVGGATNKHGEWFVWSPSIVGTLKDMFPERAEEYYNAAYELWSSVEKGLVKTSHMEEVDETESDEKPY